MWMGGAGLADERRYPRGSARHSATGFPIPPGIFAQFAQALISHFEAAQHGRTVIM